ncbi:uncharacterized protein DUF4136 [Pseudoxanthomonas sp. 3HH-4]|uniref:DUF4136 domain-containing protein n=1 Tax=Pseudoxanthomonas sp. 3HH-4 TaxID=1690214 RepID=UPI0011531EC1|nr:DUF4136 domain-containing protein [Pseudoxanthomonas sp. 3HH-4]TQM12117.1 uncharacterized protein DUF4136 [Pseudoxanthomonas sp. 3HH-4]
MNKTSSNSAAYAVRLCRALLVLAALILCACATGPKVSADYDRAADFSAYRTFGFFEPLGADTAGYETLVTQTLKSAARREMESRGYAYRVSGADLLINFSAKLAQQTRVSQVPAPMPMYYGYRRGLYGGWGGYETHVDQYMEGTLNIDIVDARRKQLVWEGVAVGRVRDKATDQREADINAAVAEVFMQYPFRVAP